MSLSEPDNFVSRFDAQPTRWSMVQRAHGQSLAGGSEARQYLVMRYSSAIRRYVRAITRNEDEADELAQEIIVRLLQGDFAGADPQKGRFRDLLKVAVRNMTRNQWAKQKVRQGVDYDLTAVAANSDPTEETVWADGWQRQLLDLAWARLKDYQDSHAGSMAYTILQLRTQFPDDSSEELAERLSEAIGKAARADQARQQLRRARVRFAEYLVAEIAEGLDRPTPEQIEEELAQLGLLDQIRDVLPPGWSTMNP